MTYNVFSGTLNLTQLQLQVVIADTQGDSIQPAAATPAAAV